jgi:hypothetical protein
MGVGTDGTRRAPRIRGRLGGIAAYLCMADSSDGIFADNVYKGGTALGSFSMTKQSREG